MSPQPHIKSTKPKKLIALPELEQWASGLAKILEHPKSLKDGQVFGSSLAGFIPSDQWWIIFFREEESPILFDYYDSASRKDNYVEGPYLVCPFYNAYLRGADPGLYRVSDLAARHPSVFARYAEYYQKPLGPLDEIGLMFPVDPRTTALVSLARAQLKWKFKAPDISALEAIFPIVRVITNKIYSTIQHNEDAKSKDRADRHNRILSVFNEFGTDVLTARELEVSRLLLKGFSAKEISRILIISEGTVRNHMKQIYIKLDVSSQAELCGFLIERLLQSY